MFGAEEMIIGEKFLINDATRWILYNQYEILRLIHANNGDYEEAKRYEMMQRVISSGYEYQFSSISPIEPRMNPSESKLVHDILDMYRAIDNARIGVSGAEINPEEIPNDLRFEGFDSNKETEYLSYALYLRDKGDYEESLSVDKNDLYQHMPMLPMYNKMLSIWYGSKDRSDLTREEILKMAAAAK